MKAQLIFNLDNEEDKAKFQEIARDDATKLKCAMHKFSEEVMRSWRKHGIPTSELEYRAKMTPRDIEYAVICKLEEKFREAMQDYDATLE